MKKFVTLHPKCEDCEGELALLEIQIDFPNCCYILRFECIVCGEEQYLILSLEDFVQISQDVLPPFNFN